MGGWVGVVVVERSVVAVVMPVRLMGDPNATKTHLVVAALQQRRSGLELAALLDDHLPHTKRATGSTRRPTTGPNHAAGELLGHRHRPNKAKEGGGGGGITKNNK